MPYFAGVFTDMGLVFSIIFSALAFLAGHYLAVVVGVIGRVRIHDDADEFINDGIGVMSW